MATLLEQYPHILKVAEEMWMDQGFDQALEPDLLTGVVQEREPLRLYDLNEWLATLTSDELDLIAFGEENERRFLQANYKDPEFLDELFGEMFIVIGM